MSIPQIPDFEVISPCGAGAYGEVWLALDHTGVLRAVKLLDKERLKLMNVLHREEKALDLFRTRAPAHPGLLSIFHVGETESHLYYVMEPADDVSEDGADYQADTMAHRIKMCGALPPSEVCELLEKLLDATECLHQKGIVHRDIKPGNIVFINGEPKLADIGLTASATESLSVAGTLSFIPPELTSGPEADLYALGKLTYCMITGNSAIGFPSLPKKLHEGLTPELSNLNRICLKACAKDPRQRFKSIGEFRVAILGECKALRTPLRRVTVWTMVAILLLVLAVGVVCSTRRQIERRVPPVVKVAPETVDEIKQRMLLSKVATELSYIHPGEANEVLGEIEKEWPQWSQSNGEFKRLKKEATALDKKLNWINGEKYYNFYANLVTSHTNRQESLAKMAKLWEDPFRRKSMDMLSNYLFLLKKYKMYDKAHEVVAYMFKLPDPKEAVKGFKYRAQIYEAQKNYGKAIGDLDKLIEKEPNNSINHLAHISLNAKFNKIDEAYFDACRWLKLVPKDKDAILVHEMFEKEYLKFKKNDAIMSKTICGRWKSSVVNEMVNYQCVTTLRPDKTVHTVGTIIQDGKTTHVDLSGTWYIKYSRLHSRVTKTNLPQVYAVGTESVDVIISVTDDRYTYRDMFGNQMVDMRVR